MVEYFGYRDVNALRTALFRFPDDPVVQAAFYGKPIGKMTFSCNTNSGKRSLKYENYSNKIYSIQHHC